MVFLLILKNIYIYGKTLNIIERGINMGTMTWADWLILIVIVIAVIAGILIFLNKKAYKKMNQQNEMIEQHKMLQTAYIIDKTRDKMTNVKSLPKAVTENVPKWSKLMKMYFVKVKIGPQILTLITDKRVFKALPVNKSVKIEIAGLYIVNMIGMKTPEQLKAIEKAKKEKAKEEKRLQKQIRKRNNILLLE